MKLTFENWLKGEIELVETYKNFDQNLERNFISLDNFEDSEKTKIQLKQKAIFTNLVSELKESFLVNFNKRFQKSKNKAGLLIAEKEKLEQFLFGEWEIEDFQKICTAVGYNFHLKLSDFGSYQNYIDKQLIQAIDFPFDFVPSPNSNFFEWKHPLPEVLAEALFLQLKFIDEKLATYNKDEEYTQNPYPLIFKDYPAYAFFEALKLNTVNADTIQADYGYIYYRLHHPRLFAINEPVKKNHFCDFLREIKVPLDSEIKTLPNTKNKTKRAALEMYLKKYLEAINSDLELEYVMEKILL